MTAIDVANGVAERLDAVRRSIDKATADAGRTDHVTLVAVTKTFEAEHIRPALVAGQRVVGENRVQEAKAKWPALREAFDDIELHLLGPLQSNKAKEAVALFDVIQSVDREKIATAIAKAADDAGRMPRCMVQVNIGREPQKAGIEPEETLAFVERCKALGLPVEALMAIPPVDEPPGPHFDALAALAADCGLKTSMGMSGDYEEAIAHGANFVRVGSAIFGSRPPIAG
ncbi:YggS family pyridoxal phosphate-dependent enzyme [Acuticoccus sp. M5D2P5]|uniref:YggS family pyridoxal phosphate-dependent enzyme n=1 Tax=Acuticoccus kalidii TaxID=2910977 RepID=UPI001F3B32F5|nr:YggS family pyridoxal phosphate-dependent enzyme [Acuticoccus kalidii]MCF3933996.1 YggS family pyridoxal phosphate-dependent enzyme [Acuticoccus kalidii]